MASEVPTTRPAPPGSTTPVKSHSSRQNPGLGSSLFGESGCRQIAARGQLWWGP